MPVEKKGDRVKILVLSDSHGRCEYMHQAIKTEKPDCVIHLGDHAGDAERLFEQYPYLPVLSVRGNCDYMDHTTPECRECMFDGVRVLMVHGHTYGVKNGLLRLYMAAKEKAVHVALFGHTHCAFCENKDGIWLMNPGTCGAFSCKTYGVVEITNGQAVCCVRSSNER